MELRFLLLPLVMAIPACAVIAPEPSTDSPYYPPPEGSRLELLQPIEIPVNDVSAWIQYGEIIRYRDADRYEPFCKFEVFSKLDRSRTVRPDTFVVERVVRNDWAVQRWEPMQLAAVGAGIDGGGPSAFIMSTEMFLESSRQPDVHRITCQHWHDARLPRHLTIEEIRRTLQGVFRLELPEE